MQPWFLVDNETLCFVFTLSLILLLTLDVDSVTQNSDHFNGICNNILCENIISETFQWKMSFKKRYGRIETWNNQDLEELRINRACVASFTILYGNYYRPYIEFNVICIGKFSRRTWVNFTQQYGKNRQRRQQNIC